MVRAYILTKREREINGFKVLLHHLKKYKDQLDEDVRFIKLAIEHNERSYEI